MCGDAASDPSMHDGPPTPQPLLGRVGTGRRTVETIAPVTASPVDPSDPRTAPTPQSPRRYVLSGGQPSEPASVALAVLGELLDEAERLETPETQGQRDIARARVVALRTARDRVAAAEAAQDWPVVRGGYAR